MSRKDSDRRLPPVTEPAARDRASAAVIRRDLDDALATERPKMALPRTRTPADEQLASAVNDLRRAEPEWHVAEHAARAVDALRSMADESRSAIDATAAEVAAMRGELTDLVAVKTRIQKTIRRGKAAIAGSVMSAIAAVGAVVYGAGVKAGTVKAAEDAAHRQARTVAHHDRVITQWLPLFHLAIDSRLGHHDRALGVDTRQPLTFPPPLPEVTP